MQDSNSCYRFMLCVFLIVYATSLTMYAHIQIIIPMQQRESNAAKIF